MKFLSKALVPVLILVLLSVPTGTQAVLSIPDLIAKIQALQEELANQQSDASSGGSSAAFTYAQDTTNPLKVTFTYTMNQGRSCNGGVYHLRYGDGTIETLQFPADVCNAYVQHSEHTYPLYGEYSADLSAVTGQGESTLQSAIITVRQLTSGSAQVLKPNGGESYRSGDWLTVKWTAKGVTRGDRACVTLYTEDSTHGYAFPSQGGCISAKNGTQSIKGKLDRTSGYDLAPGKYRAQITILGPATGGKDGPAIAEDMSDGLFTIGEGSGNGTPYIRASVFPISQTITASYGNIPTSWHAEIELTNKETGIVVGNYDIRDGGTGTLTIHPNAQETPTGTYYLSVAGGEKPWPVSDSFKLVGTAPTCMVTAESQKGGTTLVSWKSTGATSATSNIANPSTLATGSIPTNGSKAVSVTSNTIFSFWFNGPGGRGYCVSPTIYPGSSAGATINVSSPDGSLAYQTGSQVPVRWTSSNLGNYPLEIDLVRKGNDNILIASGLTNSGSYTWVPSTSIPTDTYEIMVASMAKEGSSGAGAGFSNPFKFTATPSTGVDSFSASPTSGAAPTTVTFTGTANAKKSCGGGYWTLDYGDGTTYQIAMPADLCQQKSWTTTHVYKSTGKYTATFYSGSGTAGKSLGSTVIYVSIATATANTSTDDGTTNDTSTKVPDTKVGHMMLETSAYLAIEAQLAHLLEEAKALLGH